MTDQPHDAAGAREAAQVDSAALEEAETAGIDGGPIDESDMAAAEGLAASGEVSQTYRDMIERGAATEGEGRVP